MNRACVMGAGNSAHVTAGLVASLPDWECHVYAPRKDRAQLWREGIARGGIRVCYGKNTTYDFTLRTRFSSNRAYVGLTCPMVPAPGSKDAGAAFLPDFEA